MKRREVRERDAADARQQADRRRSELLDRLRGNETVDGNVPPGAESSRPQPGSPRPKVSDELPAADPKS